MAAVSIGPRSCLHAIRDSATPPGSTTKPRRKSRFTPADEVVIAREVAAAEAYVATYSEVSECYETVAEKANENPAPAVQNNSKSIEDRYKKYKIRLTAMKRRIRTCLVSLVRLGSLSTCLVK